MEEPEPRDRVGRRGQRRVGADVPQPTRACVRHGAIAEPTGDGPAAKGKLAKKVTRKIDLADATSIPAAARTVVVTVTVRNGAGPGVLSLYEAGISRPPFGVVAWTAADQIVNAQAVIGCNELQEVKAYATAVCDVIIDISGYDTSSAAAAEATAAGARAPQALDTDNGRG